VKAKIIIAALTAAFLLLAGSFGLAFAAPVIQCPPDTDGVDTDGDGVVDNDHVCLSLTAGDGYYNMADGRLVYGFGFGELQTVTDGQNVATEMLSAEFPSPVIVAREGQKIFLTLTNIGMVMRPDIPDPHTVHFHGYPNAAPIFDGVPSASISVNMGASLTYYYNLAEPGTFIYHCHVEATEHMQMGMLGQIYVEPIQNMLPDNTALDGGFTHQAGNKYAYNDGDGSTYYDKEYYLQLSGVDHLFHEASINAQPLPFVDMKDTYPLLNGRGYPDTIDPAVLNNTENNYPSQPLPSLIEAVQGDRILLRLSSLSTTEYFTLSTPGIPMQVVGRGARLLRGPTGEDLSYMTNSVNLGGGEAMDVILDTSSVPVGEYVMYTTNFNKLSNDQEDFGGLMTKVVISAP
jgi:FtsP/CotA-like multicopper oxidase with cupredoxin domain